MKGYASILVSTVFAVAYTSKVENNIDNIGSFEEKDEFPLKSFYNGDLNLVTLNDTQYLFINRKASWFDALTFCNSHYMELVSIETEEENYILKLYIDTMDLKEDRTYNFWTSGTKLGRSRWCWLSGSPMEFTDWDEGEPSNENDNEDCISLFVRRGSEIRWNDAPCSFVGTRHGYETGFICESIFPH